MNKNIIQRILKEAKMEKIQPEPKKTSRGLTKIITIAVNKNETKSLKANAEALFPGYASIKYVETQLL